MARLRAARQRSLADEMRQAANVVQIDDEMFLACSFWVFSTVQKLPFEHPFQSVRHLPLFGNDPGGKGIKNHSSVRVENSNSCSELL